MTFEEWFNRYAPTAPELLDECAKAAWDAATLAERERCKLIVMRNQFRNGHHTHEGSTIGHYNVRMIAEIDAGLPPAESGSALGAELGENTEKKLKFQYYWKQDGCNASAAGDKDCICWHDEGTGPRKDERHDAEVPLVEWRITPANVEVSGERRCVGN